MPPGDEAVLRHVLAHEAAALDLDGLAVVLLRLFGHVAVPDGEVAVLDLDDRGVKVERQRIFNVVVHDLAVGVFIRDVAPAGDGADDAVHLHAVHTVVVAVEHDELGALELVHRELAHIRVVAQKRRRVAKQEFLRDRPALRQVAVERVEHPHAVVLHEHALGLDLVLQRLQVLDREVGLLVDVAHIDVPGAELVRLVDFLALFTQQQQRALALVKAVVLERLLDEFRLAGLQKAGEQVYRQIRRLLFRVSQCGTAPSVHPRPGATRSRTRGR